MFKKFFLSALCALSLVSALSATSYAVENQYVYVESLSIENQAASYKPGEKIEGTFLLRNAGEKDVANIFYNVQLVAVDTSKPNVKSYSIESDAKYGPVSIAAKSRSVPIAYSLEIPKTVQGENFEVKIEVASASGLPLSWQDSEAFKIETIKRMLEIQSSSIQLSDETSVALETGPVIYADKEPKTATFAALLKNNGSEAVVVRSIIAASLWPVAEDSESFKSETVEVTVEAQSANTIAVELPLNGYKPGVYEGWVNFYDGENKELWAPLKLRYIIGGEVATVHSVTATKNSLKKDDAFSINASITGSPIDPRSAEGTGLQKSQVVALDLTVFNEAGTIIAQTTNKVDLAKSSDFKFDLVASKDAEALRAALTVQNEAGVVLANYDANLSANYDAKSNARSMYFVIMVIAIAALLIVLGVFFKLRKKMVAGVSPAGVKILAALLISASMIATALYFPKASAAADPFPVSSYNIDPNVSGLVYTELLSFYHGRTYNGYSSPDTGNGENFVYTGWGPKFTFNMPIDAEYEVGESFGVSAVSRYGSCINTPASFDVGALATSDTTPSDSALGIFTPAANSTTGMTRTQSLAIFKREYKRFKPSASDAEIEASYNSKFGPMVNAAGKLSITDSYGTHYYEVEGFGSPLFEGVPAARANYYTYNTTLTAPTTPGVHKLWLGSVIANYRTVLSVNLQLTHPKYYNTVFAGGYITTAYQKIKAYQTYKVLPPSVGSLTFDNASQCGKIVVSWTRKPVYQAGQVDTYKLYRKTSTDSTYVLVSDSIPGGDTSFVDTVPAGTTGTISYRILSHHNASNLDSKPVEGNASAPTSSNCENSAGACGNKDKKYVGPNYTFSASDLCLAGTAPASNPTADAQGVYSWNCAGVGTGAGATCTAAANQTDAPMCGTATSFNTWPANNAGLCATGEVDNGAKRFDSSLNQYLWNCVTEKIGEVGCYADKPATIPSTPTNLAANGTCGSSVSGMNTVQVSFKSTQGSMPATFQIQRSTASNGTYTQIGSVPATLNPGNEISGVFYDPNAVPGATYYYKVRAVNSAGNSDWSIAVLGNSAATCVETGGKCGSATSTVFLNTPVGNPNLCSTGIPTGVAKHATEDRYVWTCSTNDGDESCQSTVGNAGSATCGPVANNTLSRVPKANNPGLCNPGTSSTPELDLQDKDNDGVTAEYYWTCTSQNGQTVRKCDAERSTWVVDNECDLHPETCEDGTITSANPSCGPATARGKLTSKPNEFTDGLCSANSSVSDIEAVGTGYSWKCNSNGKSTMCYGGLQTVVIGPGGGNPANGDVELGTFKTYPALVNKGGTCAVDVGFKSGTESAPLFKKANENTRCTLKFPDGREVDFAPKDNDYRPEEQPDVMNESFFTLTCHQVTADPVTGIESVVSGTETDPKTAVCKINPNSVETTFWEKLKTGFKDMTASAVNAFARFFNLK